MTNDTYLYTDGLETARCRGEVALWRSSHRANIDCKKAIEESIRQGFDGMRLSPDCGKAVLETFGFKRVMWVLANTIQEKSWDGRFGRENRGGAGGPSFRRTRHTRSNSWWIPTPLCWTAL